MGGSKHPQSAASDKSGYSSRRAAACCSASGSVSSAPCSSRKRMALRVWALARAVLAYASRCIGNEILMYLRKSSNRRQEASIDEPLNIDGDGNELLLSDVLSSEENQVGQRLEQDAERASLRRSVEQLSPRERQIMELRFGLLDGVERTQKEVADAIGISQSYISRLEKRIIRQLREQLGE